MRRNGTCCVGKNDGASRVAGSLGRMATRPATPRRGSGKRYKRVKAWQACHDLALAIYRASRTWPDTERFGLISQGRRAAFSAAANIAEGAAKGSELSYILLLVRELGFSKDEIHGELDALCDHASRMTWGLYQAVAKKAEAAKAG